MFAMPRRRWGARQAERRDTIFEVRYESGDDVDLLRKDLAREMGAEPINHEVYEVQNPGPDSRPLYVQFSDWKMYVGTGVWVRDQGP
jgi:hypothetical protein